MPRALADPPLSILKGDGLVVRVLTLSNDGTMVAGELTRGDGTHAFTGRISSDGDVEIVRGSFRVGQKTFEFSSSQPEGEDLVTLTIGGERYRLREVSLPDVRISPSEAVGDPSANARPLRQEDPDSGPRQQSSWSSSRRE